MKRRFTIVAATLALLAIFIAPLGMMGQNYQQLYTADFTTVATHSYTQNKTFTLNNKSWTSSVSQVNGGVFYLGCNSSNASYGVLGNNSTFSDINAALIATGDHYTSGTSHAYALRFDNAYNNVTKVVFEWAGGNNAFQVHLFGYTGSGYVKLATTNYATSGATTSGSVEWTGNATNYTKFAIVARPGATNSNATSKTLRAATFTIYTTPSSNPYTVTLGDTGATLTESSAGAGVTLPTRSNVSPWTFAGWSTTNNQTETNTAPTIIPAGHYSPTANITLYPVYTRTEGGSSTTEWHLTALNDADAGTYALLTDDGHAFNGTLSSGHGQITNNAFAFNASGVATSVPTGICEITFQAVTGGFKMYNASKGYLYASKAGSGGLGWHNSEDSYWSYQVLTNQGNWEYSKNYSGSKARLRSYNDSSFRTYNANNGDPIKLAKKVTVSGSTTYYISVVALPISITISGNNITLDADDDDIHNVAVSYQNLNAANLNTTEYLFVECYTDANCQNSIPSNHWFTADFEVNSSTFTTDYESIEYMADANETTSDRTVYMRVEHYSQTTDNWTYSNVIAITQLGAVITVPTCTISPAVYDFGTIAIGTSQTYTFTVNTTNLTSALSVSMLDGDVYSVSPATIPASASSTNVVVTFSPDAAGLIQDMVVIEGNDFSSEITADVSGTGAVLCTVTYVCNGGKATAPAQGSVFSGGRYQLANGTNLNSDFTFVGWTIDPAFVEDADIYQAGDWINVSSNETYYAVYSHSVFHGTGNKYYEKVTENLSDWSGDYLMVYDEYVDLLNNVYVFDSPYDETSENTYARFVDIYDYYSNNRIEFNGTTSVYEIAIAKTDNGYSLYDKGSEAYLGYNNATGATGARLRWDESFTSSQNEWTVSTNNVLSVFNSERAIRWNSTSPRFAIYIYSNQDPVSLYKYVEEGTTTTARYTRVFLNETAEDDIEIVGPSIIPSGNSLNMDEYELVNEYDDEVTGDLERAAANLVIEEGAQLIHNDTWDVPATMQKNIAPYSGELDNYYLMSLPFGSYDVAGSPFVTVNGNAYVAPQNYDFYRFDGSQTQEEWQQVGTNEAFEAGVGFLYANNVGGTLNLMGTLVSSETPWETWLEYDATTPYGGWNLIGNPFACYAQPDCNNFYVIAGEEVVPSTTDIVAPLQGILVLATDEDQCVTFTREGEAKSAQTLTVNLYKDNASKGGAVVDRAIVRFDESTNLEKFQLNPNHTKVYFVEGNKEYAVVRSVNEGELPVNFKAEKNGSYTINVETENVEMNYLHLIDYKTGADVDLLQTPSYTFEANVGDNVNRFRLMFDANAIDEHNAEASFAYFNGSEWVISNMGDATLQVVDVMGRVLSSETINGNAELSISEVPGVYMFRLVNGNNVKVQKVVVR